MSLLRDIEEAWELVLEASAAIEDSERLHGRASEEARLARAAFNQWLTEYMDLTSFDENCFSVS